MLDFGCLMFDKGSGLLNIRSRMLKSGWWMLDSGRFMFNKESVL
jgi:hypothetical protein